MGSRILSLADLLERALSEDAPALLHEGGIIREGYDAEVDEYRGLRKHGKEYLAKLQSDEITKTGIQNMKLKSNQVFGYFFEVPKGQIKNVPDYFIRKQTLVNAERYITPELKEYEEKVFSSEEKLVAREDELFHILEEEVLSFLGEIQEAAEAIAELDLLSSFAETASKRRYTMPEITDAKIFRIKNGRHPVVEAIDEMEGRDRFVPNDLLMDEHSFQLVTGPNMSGKSTFLRQNALIILLAHIGSFVPAEEAVIPLTDGIFTRIGAGDALSKGQSTFLVEMQEASHILRNATDNSFVILDEIGRGTSTFDGLSLAWAITEHLAAKGIKTLFATHYHELIDLTETLPNGKNLSVAVLENAVGVTFLHRIVEGGASKSFGIEVAELAGVPKKVTERAREILTKLENNEIESEYGEFRRKRSAQALIDQQNLFTIIEQVRPAKPSAVEEELKKLDINRMTPIEALQKMYELKKRAEEGSS